MQNEWRVPPECHGQRADVALAQGLDLSRSAAQRLLREGKVTRGDKVLAPRTSLAQGDCVCVEMRDATDGPAPCEMALDVVYEDGEIVVINKPAGLVVHPAAGHADDTLVSGLLARYGELPGDATRPGIVHRLDKMTSGLMVVARTPAAHASLTDQLARRDCGREYLALVARPMGELEGRVDAMVGRHPRDRQRMAVVPTGRAATTDWRALENYAAGALLLCKLHTGRTHQIRVHMAHIGHPVLDDPQYGSGVPGARQMLHAARLSLNHPATGDKMSFTTPPPEDFLRRLRGIGGSEWAERLVDEIPEW